ARSPLARQSSPVGRASARPLATRLQVPDTLYFAEERPFFRKGPGPRLLRANSSISARFWLSLAATLGVVPFFPVESRNLGRLSQELYFHTQTQRCNQTCDKGHKFMRCPRLRTSAGTVVAVVIHRAYSFSR